MEEHITIQRKGEGQDFYTQLQEKALAKIQSWQGSCGRTITNMTPE